ncbi:MAG TPA: gliding motility-associated ABC transporter substrate-binding protein GldG [Bacteroidales bacterium]|nr:gliding motility-associated ABC transporter substrate-binding protein GldG [Bacteroidales bacterium]
MFLKFQNKISDAASSGRSHLKKSQILGLILSLAIIVLLNLVGSIWFFRLDLTSEKRFTLTQGTREMLRNLNDVVYFRVYLHGELPAEFARLRQQTQEMLDEFRAFTPYVQYEFIDPIGESETGGLVDMLIEKGLQPTQVQVRTQGAATRQTIFPGAVVSFAGKEIAIQLLGDFIGKSPLEVLNYSAQALEYRLANAIRQATIVHKPRIGFLEGQGELADYHLLDIADALSDFYQVGRIVLNNNLDELLSLQTLIIPKPTRPFTEAQKFMLDQFVMHGGSVLWLIDPVFASMDSLRAPTFESIGMAWPLNLEDILFQYGVRLNNILLKDLQAAPIPVTTGMMGNRPQIDLLPWFYFPLLGPASNHTVVKNLNMIRSEFVSSIDTVSAPGVDKTILLHTSPYTQIVATPASIALSVLHNPPDPNHFAMGAQPVAVLLEGTFRSVFENRIIPDVELPMGYQPLTVSQRTAMIVVADGDIIKNQIDRHGQPQPLGFDRFSGQNFGNRDFIVNAVDYLAHGPGILEARGRELRLRLLDRERVNRNREWLQLINIGGPIVWVSMFGFFMFWWRKRKYGKRP